MPEDSPTQERGWRQTTPTLAARVLTAVFCGLVGTCSDSRGVLGCGRSTTCRCIVMAGIYYQTYCRTRSHRWHGHAYITHVTSIQGTRGVQGHAHGREKTRVQGNARRFLGLVNPSRTSGVLKMKELCCEIALVVCVGCTE